MRSLLHHNRSMAVACAGLGGIGMAIADWEVGNLTSELESGTRINLIVAQKTHHLQKWI
jgi:hypothetical protein